MRKFTKIILVALLLVTSFHNIKIQAETSTPKIDEIKRKGKIILGTSPDYPPYEFQSTISGKTEIAGFDIEIAKQIAKELEVDLEIKSLSFDGLLPALTTGTIDFIIAGMSPTEERQKSVDFSDVYYKGENKVLTKDKNIKEYKDLENKQIGAQKASLQEDLAKEIPGSTVRGLGSILDLVQELKNDKVDAVIIEKSVAKQFSTKDSTLIISDVVLPINADGSAIAVQKGNTDLTEVINKVIKDLQKENKIDKFYTEALLLSEKETQSTDSFFEKYAGMLLKGTIWTIGVAFFGVIIGSILGVLLALGKLSSKKIISYLVSTYIEIVRGTPILVQIYIVYFGLPAIGVTSISPVVAGIMAISLNSAAYVAEIIRAGIESIDSGQLEASRSLGMSYSQSMKVIIIPQAIKNILPALGNEFITIIKESSIISVIGVTDLMYVANTIRGNTYEPFKPLLIAAAIYFILTFTLSRGLKKIEGNMNKNAKN